MKKVFLICLLSMCLCFGGLAFAGQKNLTFAWNQPESPGLAGWKLYKSAAPGAGYQLAATIAYDGTVRQEYTSAQALTSPDGQAVTYYFVLTAFDSAGNESGYSNEVSAEIDFEAPGIPVQLKVTVQAQ